MLANFKQNQPHLGKFSLTMRKNGPILGEISLIMGEISLALGDISFFEAKSASFRP
jgi:hypothetical protein